MEVKITNANIKIKMNTGGGMTKTYVPVWHDVHHPDDNAVHIVDTKLSHENDNLVS
jgi:hypothetical protein